MKYGILAKRNREYKEKIWRELDDLYEGGYQLYENAKKYILPHPGETDVRYQARLECCAYINHLGAIINRFVNNLFGQKLSITQGADSEKTGTPGKAPVDPEFYTAFAHDSDLKGSQFVQILKCSLTTALLKRKCIVAVDLPTVPETAEIVTRADEDKLGTTRAYCYEIPIEQLIDWEYDEQGNFKWAILHRVIENRDTPEARADDTCVEEFKIWRKLIGPPAEEGEPRIVWEIYRTEPHKMTQPMQDQAEVALFNRGETTFRWIPLVELCLPKGLWAGNILGRMAREHYTRRSSLVAGEQDSLHAIPFAKLGPEVGGVGEAMPSEVQQNPNRGKEIPRRFAAQGFVEIGSEDELGFAEPTGNSYTIVDDQLDKLVDEMYRVSQQMASSIANTTTSLGRSGKSKEEDRHATEVVLGELGNLIRDYGKKVYETVSASRGDDTIWTPHGLDKYDMQDRETVLEEATTEPLITTGSKTFKKLYRTKIAYALLGDMPPETQDTIREEIEKSVDQEELVAKVQRENPELAMPAAPAVPKVGAPAVPKSKRPMLPPVKQPGQPGQAAPNGR